VVSVTTSLIAFLLAEDRWPYEADIDGVPEDAPGARDLMSGLKASVDSALARCNADKELMSAAFWGALAGRGWVKLGETIASEMEFVQPEMPPGVTDVSRIPMLQMPVRISVARARPSMRALNPWAVLSDPFVDDPAKGLGQIEIGRVYPHELYGTAKNGDGGWVLSRVLKVLASRQSTSTAGGGDGGTGADGTNTTDHEAPGRRKQRGQDGSIVFREGWIKVPRKMVEEEEQAIQDEEGSALDDLFASAGAGGEARVVDAGSQPYGPMPPPEPAVDIPEEADVVDVVAVEIDGQIVRLMRVDPDEKLLKAFTWPDAAGDTFPRSFADQIVDDQQLMNDLVRSFVDNKKLAANVIWAVKAGMLDECPEKLYPGARIEVSDGARSVQDAISFPQIPDFGGRLMDAIQLVRQIADDDSMFSRISQGLDAVEGGDDETAYAQGKRLERGDTFIQYVLRAVDEGLVAPVGQWFADWVADNDASVPYVRVRATGYQGYNERMRKAKVLRDVLVFALSHPTLTALNDVNALNAAFMEAVGQRDKLRDPAAADAMLQPVAAPAQDPLQEVEVSAKARKLDADAQLSEARARQLSDSEMRQRALTVAKLAGRLV
jgi:hypothetical protein